MGNKGILDQKSVMNKSKRKGDRFERNLVKRARSAGVTAFRQFLSRAPINDKVDIVISDYKIQCKKRAKGFVRLYKELDEVDCLILGADCKEPLTVLRFKDWLKLIKGGNREDENDRNSE